MGKQGLGLRELGGIYAVVIGKHRFHSLFVPSSVASVLPPVVKLSQWSLGFVASELFLDDFLHIDLNIDIYENYFLFPESSYNATGIMGNYVV